MRVFCCVFANYICRMICGGVIMNENFKWESCLLLDKPFEAIAKIWFVIVNKTAYGN